MTDVDRKSFVEAVQKNFTVESQGYQKSDYDRIVAVK